MCDYEIETDLLASQIGEAIHVIRHIHKEDLLLLCEQVYHANGSIRGHLAITPQDLEKLKTIEEHYAIPCRQFVLPQGSIGACKLHVLRSQTKKVIRHMHRIQNERNAPGILWDYFNRLSNLFFMMALYENQAEAIEEIPFLSRSYDS